MAEPTWRRGLPPDRPQGHRRRGRPVPSPRSSPPAARPTASTRPERRASVAASVAAGAERRASAGASAAAGSRVASAATTPTPASRRAHGGRQRRVHGGDRHQRQDNTVDHSTFQDQISNYLGGTPDTAYTWFSGFRMKFFADQGLPTPIDDVWAKVKDNFTEGFAEAVVGQRRQGLRHPGRLLPVGGLLPQERLRRQGLHSPDDLGRLQGPVPRRCRPTASSRSPSATRTAGPRWARSTSSTCGSTATTSTST